MPTLTEYYAQVEEELARSEEELAKSEEKLAKVAKERARNNEEYRKFKLKTIKRNLASARFLEGKYSPEVIESLTNVSKDLQTKIIFVPDDAAYEMYLVEMIIKAKDMIRDKHDFDEVQQITSLSSSAIEMINNSLDAKIFDYLADLEKIAWE
jgi:hypothetical protein